jgi:pyruvate kinase
MSVARINFSHGTAEDHRRRVDIIRSEARERLVAVGILADIPGPKLRTGRFEGGALDLEAGEEVRLRWGGGVAQKGEVLLNFEGFFEAVTPGNRIVLADGRVELVAEGVQGDAIVAGVRRGGIVRDRQGVHLPDSPIDYELPTEEDRDLIQLALEMDVDMIGISFVSCADDVRRVAELAPGMIMVAKIERQAALENLDEILAVADGIMVARGDLGVELALEELPLVQKTLIQSALRAGKFTITATEMLESMVTASRPTRAEVTDVANAVLDGTDAIMLSAETAVGEYPIDAVATMQRIASAVELSQRYHDLPRPSFRSAESNFANAAAMAAVQAAEALGIQKIVCFTESGNTVRLLSRYRPNAKIIALSPHQKTINHMTLLGHVRPILFRREASLEDMLHMAAEMLVARGISKYGEEVVFVAGVPPGIASSTNVVKLHRIGEEAKLH